MILGLCGEEPETVDPGAAEELLAKIRERGALDLLGEFPIGFAESEDIRFDRDEKVLHHPNGMTFTAFNCDRDVIRTENFYSIGGGFVVGEEGPVKDSATPRLPYSFASAAELMKLCDELHLHI